MKIDLSEISIKALFYFGNLKHVGTEHDTCKHVAFIRTISEDSAEFECLDCCALTGNGVFVSKFVDTYL